MNAQQLIAKIKQHPLATVCAVLTVLLVAFIFLRAGALSQSESEYNAIIDQIDQMDKNDQNSVGLAADVEEINQMVGDIQSRLIKERARADHYRYFLSLAESSEVTIGAPVFGDYLVAGAKGSTIMTQELSQVSYRLSVQGKFNHIMAFIYRLTTGRYLVRIDNMSISGNQQQGPEMAAASLEIHILAESPPKKEKKDK